MRVRQRAEPEGGVPAEVLLGFPVHEYTAKPADPSTSKRYVAYAATGMGDCEYPTRRSLVCAYHRAANSNTPSPSTVLYVLT